MKKSSKVRAKRLQRKRTARNLKRKNVTYQPRLKGFEGVETTRLDDAVSITL